MATDSPQVQPGLSARKLFTRHALVTSLAVITPTGAIFFITIPMAANAGAAMPFAFVAAFATVLLIVNAVMLFAGRVAHAGSFFAFVRLGLGARSGFFAGWMFLAFYPLVQVYSLVIFGEFVSTIIQSQAHANVPWWLLSVAGAVVVWLISVLGIRMSIRTDLALLTFEALVVGALAVTILAKAHNTVHVIAHSFNPAAAPLGAGGIAVAVVFGIQAFTGFEAASYLGEEVDNPRRRLPRAILLSTLLVGVVFIFFACVGVLGYGPENMATKYAADAAPWDTLGQMYWHSNFGVLLIDIAASVAALAGGMASQNGAARMLFALGREGLLPKSLAKTNARLGTPVNALTTLLVLGVGLTVGLGQAYGPLSAFSLLGLVVTLAALVVYAIVQVACVAYFRSAADVSVWRKIVFPVLAVAVICYIAYKSIVPLPAAPLSYAIWIALGWAAAGLVVVGVLSARGVSFAGLSRAVDDAEPQEIPAESHA